jgi:hypothetical protein
LNYANYLQKKTKFNLSDSISHEINRLQLIKNVSLFLNFFTLAQSFFHENFTIPVVFLHAFFCTNQLPKRLFQIAFANSYAVVGKFWGVKKQPFSFGFGLQNQSKRRIARIGCC